MQEEYLNKVMVYLKKELPAYQDQLDITDGRLVFVVPQNAKFQPYYEELFTSVSECVDRVRNRKRDIDFTVRSLVQERDYRIIK